MHPNGLVPFLVLGIVLAASTSGLGQESGRASAGAAAGASAGADGAEPWVSLAPSSVFVDPVLVDGFEVNLTQIAILVYDGERESSVLAALDGFGVRYHPFGELDMASMVLPRDQLEDVAGVPGVLVVFRNERMELMLDMAAPYVGAPVVWNTYGVTGGGPSIMVVDSGVDGTHPDTKLGENLLQNVLAVPRPGDIVAKNVENVAFTDFDGHGTHVASIAAGTAKASNQPGRYKGIAWGTKLVGYAAGIIDPASGDVSFESLTVLEAFNYALAKQKLYDIGVVSNSWGANGEFEVNSPINIATLQMYKRGLLVTFAAGNEGADGAHTLNKYSVAPWVLSVAAGDYLNQIPRFSSRGTDPAKSGLPYDHPDITAPGVGITAAKGVAATANKQAPAAINPGEYVAKSGTSMATPVVSGAAALLLTANPKLSPDNVMDILTATATPLPYEVWDAGAGYMNLLKAFQLAKKTPGDRAEFLSGKVKYAGRESGDPKLERDPVTVGYGEGQAVQVESGAQGLGEFTTELVTTAQGVVFVVGTVVLSALAFGTRRRP